ncbi:MAG: M56 family metallopeptidase [Limisphaerales bacterium]
MKTPAIIIGAAAVVPILSDAALKSVALLILVGALMLSLRKASAATRHTVWIFAMVGLLALPILSFSLPKWTALPSAFQIAAPPSDIEPSMAPTIATLPTPMPLEPVAPTTKLAEPLMAPAAAIDISSALVLLWAAGAVLLLLRLLLSHWLLRSLARSSRIEPALQARFERTRQSLEIPVEVALRVSSNSVMPQTFGFFRPSVVLPADAVSTAGCPRA